MSGRADKGLMLTFAACAVDNPEPGRASATARAVVTLVGAGGIAAETRELVGALVSTLIGARRADSDWREFRRRLAERLDLAERLGWYGPSAA